MGKNRRGIRSAVQRENREKGFVAREYTELAHAAQRELAATTGAGKDRQHLQVKKEEITKAAKGEAAEEVTAAAEAGTN